MMGLDDRLTYFILGCLIGIVIGYVTKSLRTIEKKVDAVDKIVKDNRSEDGFFRLPSKVDIQAWFVKVKIWLAYFGRRGLQAIPTWTDIKSWPVRTWHWLRTRRVQDVALFLVVALSVLASFQSQVVSNHQKEISNHQAAQDKRDHETQMRIVRITTCNSQFLGKLIVALNERTTYSTAQANANVTLQEGQLKVLLFGLTIPPPTAEQGKAAVDEYLQKLHDYIDLATKTAGKTLNNPYPTLEEFTSCVDKNQEIK
jgi:hypothetical protein